MKLVYNEGEKERLREFFENDKSVRLFSGDPDKVYSLSFKVTDPCLAQAALPAILNNMIDFDIGIDVISINFSDLPNREEVKDKLHRMIDEIIP